MSRTVQPRKSIATFAAYLKSYDLKPLEELQDEDQDPHDLSIAKFLGRKMAEDTVQKAFADGFRPERSRKAK